MISVDIWQLTACQLTNMDYSLLIIAFGVSSYGDTEQVLEKSKKSAVKPQVGNPLRVGKSCGSLKIQQNWFWRQLWRVIIFKKVNLKQ